MPCRSTPLPHRGLCRAPRTIRSVAKRRAPPKVPRFPDDWRGRGHRRQNHPLPPARRHGSPIPAPQANSAQPGPFGSLPDPRLRSTRRIAVTTLICRWRRVPRREHIAPTVAERMSCGLGTCAQRVMLDPSSRITAPAPGQGRIVTERGSVRARGRPVPARAARKLAARGRVRDKKDNAPCVMMGVFASSREFSSCSPLSCCR